MASYPWAYCLDESQFDKLFRIICKVPGLKDFLNHNPGSDLTCLLYSYRSRTVNTGILSVGVSINIDVLISRYAIYKKEYDAAYNNIREFELDTVLSWPNRPCWAENMSIEEIDYLDHFIPLVEGLSSYLYKNKSMWNLYDLVVYFQMRLHALRENTSHADFVLDTIKERFYRIMDDHHDAIHYVNHSHEIDDYDFIRNFDLEARKHFYLKNLEKDICSEFANKYIKFSNPYVASEIFLRYFRADKIDIALSFAHRAFKYIFASPNIYWHNKESIYGSVNILYVIIEALGMEGLNAISLYDDNIFRCVIECVYLLLSRTIYWYDKETVDTKSYNENILPIGIQHKLRAYRLRANIISDFSELIPSKCTQTEIKYMIISDLLSAHDLAYSTQIVGENSLFKNDAQLIFDKLEDKGNTSIEKISVKGFELNDALSKDLFNNYKKGRYCLSEQKISLLISRIRLYLKDSKKAAQLESRPIPYLKKDNYSPVLKTEKNEILQYLINSGITCFYHFTESDKLYSIIKFGGLLSYRRCLDEGIVLPIRSDMSFSRDIDAKLGLEDYARLSFSKRLPKIEVRKSEGAKLIMLQVSIEVALFEDTIFTNIEATSPGLKYGTSLKDLQNVNVAAIKRIPNPRDADYLESQAEVLIKGMIPLKYILNIDNPIQLN